MAEAFLEIVLKNMNSLIQDEIGLIMGVDGEMKKLFSTFTTIQAVLEDAENKQIESKAIRNWLCKITDLAYEIDDILDECATHVSKLKLKNSRLNRYSLKKLLFRHNIGRRMKKVNEELDAVAAERAKFHLLELPIVRRREVTAARETGSILNDSQEVYGREEDKEEIIDVLVNQARDSQEISVLPIIGVGGLGKTTLAQLVFKDQRVVEHFELTLWVCVSDNFDVKRLVRAMIESASGSGNAKDLEHMDTLQRRLWKLLNRKRYLLVLDDVWNGDQEKWFELKNILACGSNGTSIIVTTRLMKVAGIMGTLPAHCLTGLSEDHCWMLLRDRAFGEEEKEKYPNLEVIGKQIVRKCAGVPMAAKALGGLLRFKRKEKEWIYIKESEIWNLPEEEALILPALRLSYHHLPLELRQCFAYFAIFPKDYEIEKEELIFLWMSHGYISSRGTLEVEDVGNEICDELVLRSLFQSFTSSGETYIFMHDLVHDLAQSIMENKVPGAQLEKHVTSTSSSKIREVNLRKKYVAFPVSTQRDMDISSILTEFSRLRVLNASLREIKDLPSSVGNLKHLRSLNLSGSEISTLPNSICSLWNLQILNLDCCRSLMALPKNMRYLKNLCHLLLEKCGSLSGMPPKIGELTRLRTLSMFIVGHGRGNQLEELQSLNLGGRLKIKQLERVETYMDDVRANLVEKNKLRYLCLVWGSHSAGEDIDEKVLEALRPHPNLETLIIKGFNGRCLPAWMADSTLDNTTDIEIIGCQNIVHLPQLGKLPHLKRLRLQNLAVEYIVEDEVQGGDPSNVHVLLPSLEKLELFSLPHLKGLSKEQVVVQVLPNLVNLTIVSCFSLVLPELSSIRELAVENCSSLMLASFSHLETLEVGLGESMKCIPVGTLEKLTNLKTLRVLRPEEVSIPEDGLRALKSLTTLDVHWSETMTCLPERWLRHLTALNSLYIDGNRKFVELPEEIKHLKYLEDIQLSGSDEMVCLPEALRHLSLLKTLYILNLPRLSSLPDWLGNLTSLSFLQINDFPKLVSLPACIRGMQNLQRIYIRGCPELERRCERRTGQDWHKIAHIRSVQIGEY